MIQIIYVNSKDCNWEMNWRYSVQEVSMLTLGYKMQSNERMDLADSGSWKRYWNCIDWSQMAQRARDHGASDVSDRLFVQFYNNSSHICLHLMHKLLHPFIRLHWRRPQEWVQYKRKDNKRTIDEGKVSVNVREWEWERRREANFSLLMQRTTVNTKSWRSCVKHWDSYREKESKSRAIVLNHNLLSASVFLLHYPFNKHRYKICIILSLSFTVSWIYIGLVRACR